MPVGYMVWGGAAGLAAGGLALLAGLGSLWAGLSYAMIGGIAVALIVLR